MNQQPFEYAPAADLVDKQQSAIVLHPTWLHEDEPFEMSYGAQVGEDTEARSRELLAQVDHKILSESQSQKLQPVKRRLGSSLSQVLPPCESSQKLTMKKGLDTAKHSKAVKKPLVSRSRKELSTRSNYKSSSCLNSSIDSFLKQRSLPQTNKQKSMMSTEGTEQKKAKKGTTRKITDRLYYRDLLQRMVKKNQALKSKQEEEDRLISNMTPQLSTKSIEIVNKARAAQPMMLNESDGIFQSSFLALNSGSQFELGVHKPQAQGPLYKRYQHIVSQKEALLKKLRREVRQQKKQQDPDNYNPPFKPDISVSQKSFNTRDRSPGVVKDFPQMFETGTLSEPPEEDKVFRKFLEGVQAWKMKRDLKVSELMLEKTQKEEEVLEQQKTSKMSYQSRKILQNRGRDFEPGSSMFAPTSRGTSRNQHYQTLNEAYMQPTTTEGTRSRGRKATKLQTPILCSATVSRKPRKIEVKDEESVPSTFQEQREEMGNTMFRIKQSRSLENLCSLDRFTGGELSRACNDLLSDHHTPRLHRPQQMDKFLTPRDDGHTEMRMGGVLVNVETGNLNNSQDSSYKEQLNSLKDSMFKFKKLPSQRSAEKERPTIEIAPEVLLPHLPQNHQVAIFNPLSNQSSSLQTESKPSVSQQTPSQVTMSQLNASQLNASQLTSSQRLSDLAYRQQQSQHLQSEIVFQPTSTLEREEFGVMSDAHTHARAAPISPTQSQLRSERQLRFLELKQKYQIRRTQQSETSGGQPTLMREFPSQEWCTPSACTPAEHLPRTPGSSIQDQNLLMVPAEQRADSVAQPSEQSKPVERDRLVRSFHPSAYSLQVTEPENEANVILQTPSNVESAFFGTEAFGRNELIRQAISLQQANSAAITDRESFPGLRVTSQQESSELQETENQADETQIERVNSSSQSLIGSEEMATKFAQLIDQTWAATTSGERTPSHSAQLGIVQALRQQIMFSPQ